MRLSIIFLHSCLQLLSELLFWIVGAQQMYPQDLFWYMPDLISTAKLENYFTGKLLSPSTINTLFSLLNLTRLLLFSPKVCCTSQRLANEELFSWSTSFLHHGEMRIHSILHHDKGIHIILIIMITKYLARREIDILSSDITTIHNLFIVIQQEMWPLLSNLIYKDNHIKKNPEK